MYVQLADLFVPITVFLYSPFFFIWLFHSYFTLYNTFSQFLYSSILVQLAMFLLVTSLLIFNHLTAPIFSLYFCVATQFNDKLISFLPLYLQDVLSFPLLSHSHLFSNFFSQFYLYSTGLYIILLSPAIFHFAVTQIRFHTVQEVARRSCSPSTDDQSGGAHKEAVHTAANDLCLEPNKSIKLQSNAQMAVLSATFNVSRLATSTFVYLYTFSLSCLLQDAKINQFVLLPQCDHQSLHLSTLSLSIIEISFSFYYMSVEVLLGAQ